MARKEDMLPPGWDDLDRYVDRWWNLSLYPFHFGKYALTWQQADGSAFYDGL